LARPERCFADFAAHATFKELAQSIAGADRRRLVTVRSVINEVEKRKRFPGRTVLRAVLTDMASGISHSSYERLGRRLLAAAGHRPHRRPLAIAEGGRLLAEIDIPFEPLLYGVEIDGPHHLLAAVAAADRIRDRTLERIGWRIDRFFWFELEERPQWFVTEVTRQLERHRTRHR